MEYEPTRYSIEATKSSKKQSQIDTFDSLYREFIEGDAEEERLYQQEWVNADIARQLYELWAEAGLTQRELAKLAGTSASVIACLENADYHGHSLSMLLRIAAVLNRRVPMTFVDTERKTRQPADR